MFNSFKSIFLNNCKGKIFYDLNLSFVLKIICIIRENARNEEQIKAMEKLRKLQEAMLEGGKRAGDKDLKERRQKKKKAAEKRLKVRIYIFRSLASL